MLFFRSIIIFHLITLITLVISVTLTQPSYATEINAEGVSRLKSIFEKLVKNHEDVTKTSKSRVIKFDGEVIVEPSSTYYAITMPHARIEYPDGTQIDLGMVAINAIPHTNPWQWRIATALPTPIIIFDAEGRQTARIDISGQKSAGIWDERFDNFIKLSASYQDIIFRDSEEQFSIKVPEIIIRYDFNEDEQERLSGSGFISLKNIEAVMPDRATNINIGELRFDFFMDKYNISSIKEYQEKITAMSKRLTESGDNNMLELYDMIADMVANSWNGIEGSYSASNIHISTPGNGAINEANLGKALFGFAMNGFNSGQVNINWNLNYNDFSISTQQPEFNGIIPSDMNIAINFENIPLHQLLATGKKILHEAAEQPEKAGMAGMSFMMQLPAILSEAGTSIVFNDNYIGADKFRIELNGQAKADSNAANSVTLEATATFHGLDALLKHAQAMSATADSEISQQFQKAIPVLTMAKGMAKPEVNPDGTISYIYELIIAPEGEILLNGQDMSMMIGGVIGSNSMAAP